jgi:UDP-N-acetyl-D-glucosamine dehydrogenase
MTSVKLTPDAVRAYDAVVIVTDHRDVDYGMIAESAGLIIDTRDAMRSHMDKVKGRVVLA